jgi:hypothetical protein
MALSDAEKWLDHLGSCSPCYRDFSELQSAQHRRQMRMILAVAAAVLIVAGLATWAILRPQDQQIARAVVDLRDRSVARGTEPAPLESPLEIPRNAAHLDIYLPLGSSEGSYDMRITSVSGEPLFSGAAEAKLEQGLTVLHIDLGMSLTKPGRYFLYIRRHTSEWVSFPLQIR